MEEIVLSDDSDDDLTFLIIYYAHYFGFEDISLKETIEFII